MWVLEQIALTSNVTLGQLLCPSVPHFLPLLNRDDKVPSAYGHVEVKLLHSDLRRVPRG